MNLVRYAFEPENYLLMVRVAHSALLVRRWLGDESLHPGLKSAIAAAEKSRLAPQPNWRISGSRKIIGAAGLAIRFPYRWGACVHQSLIAYRLLNGYGFSATLNLGITRDGKPNEGHAWVTAEGMDLSHTNESRFQTVYRIQN